MAWTISTSYGVLLFPSLKLPPITIPNLQAVATSGANLTIVQSLHSAMPLTDPNSLTLPLHASGDNSTKAPNLAPWREFFNIHAHSIPDSFLDATTRLNRNLTHFSVNYINLVLSITYLYLGFAVGPLPFTLFAFYLVSSITCFLIYVKSDSLLLQRLFLSLLVSITVLLFVVVHAWIDLLAVSVIFTFVVCLHGVLIKVPSNEFDGLRIDAQPQPDQSRPLV